MTWRAASYGAWAALALACLGCQVVSVAAMTPVDTAGRFIRRLTTRPALRLLLVLGWMWCGWHFFAR